MCDEWEDDLCVCPCVARSCAMRSASTAYLPRDMVRDYPALIPLSSLSCTRSLTFFYSSNIYRPLTTPVSPIYLFIYWELLIQRCPYQHNFHLPPKPSHHILLPLCLSLPHSLPNPHESLFLHHPPATPLLLKLLPCVPVSMYRAREEEKGWGELTTTQ